MDQQSSDLTVRNGLLAWLLTKGLVRQPEVTVTSSIAWLCQRRGAAAALGDLIRESSAGQLQQEDNSTWRAEERASDGTRTDLECWWGQPQLPWVVIEAKLDASMTAAQVAGYIGDQANRIGDEPGVAMFVVLAPAHRRREASQAIEEALTLNEATARRHSDGRLRTDVWDFDQVLDALAAGLGDDPDLAQLRILVRACEALDVKPLTPDELRNLPPSRRSDLISVLNRATAAATPSGRLMPSGADEHYEWRRYIVVVPGGTNIAVGLLRPPDDNSGQRSSQVWLRVHKDTPNAAQAGKRLREGCSDATTDASGHTWVPLRVLPHVGGAAMVHDLVEQINDAMTAI